jgi:hypothetical protein
MGNGKKTRSVGRPELPKSHVQEKIVPVRVKSRYLKFMNSAARASKKNLSVWIRNAVKNELNHGGFMNEYQQQIEAGKEIVLRMLATLAVELDTPELRELSFHVTDGDFDHDCISLVDRKRFHVVAKVQDADLADCPADGRVRSRLDAELKQAIRAFYEPKKRIPFSN